MAKFSIVIASYLGQYKSAASNREAKLRRALLSTVQQNYPPNQYEVLLIADGCDRTAEIYMEMAGSELKGTNTRCLKIERSKLWSGRPRNAGIQQAINDWIVYLDIDDMIGPDHLAKIAAGIERNPKPVDWVYFGDWSYNGKDQCFRPHDINIAKKGECGTSNIAHRKAINAQWPTSGNYMHDWYFIGTLRRHTQRYAEIIRPEYLICHVPGILDYDGDDKIMKLWNKG